MSTLAVGTIRNLAGTASTSSDNVIQGSAKAWVNFNGTTSPATIRASYNVSSVTRWSEGSYQINFTTAFEDANYATCISGGYWPGVEARLITNIDSDTAASTTSFRIRSVYYSNAVGTSSDRYAVSVFR